MAKCRKKKSADEAVDAAPKKKGSKLKKLFVLGLLAGAGAVVYTRLAQEPTPVPPSGAPSPGLN
ncbi:MAG: hypothetical protein QM621_06925 [Aeromicrobium sp.]|uniref:hypothetical protein n=1 Tax=Aeromicrobium sp. TaxID=1871063 RepID=UPI0039E3B0A1